MKANELMIGDWVQNPLGWKAQVQSIRYVNTIKDEWEWLVKIGINNETFQGNLSLNEIGAIPLTAEILEENGFELVRDKLGRVVFYSIADDYFDLRIDEITDSIWCIEYDNLEAQFPTCRNLVAHVHELQHAMHLCGIEKEIEL